jgi:HD-GYP domain-containing protein (c-di-GMP phosphodiesterase class II)
MYSLAKIIKIMRKLIQTMYLSIFYLYNWQRMMMMLRDNNTDEHSNPVTVIVKRIAKKR